MEIPEDMKYLAGQYRSLKGWLTKSISSAENLIKMTNISNSGFLAARIEQAMKDLDDRLAKINTCLAAMQEKEFNRADDDARKKREKYYSEQCDECSEKHEKTLLRLVNTSSIH